jgi:hypothetical protein
MLRFSGGNEMPKPRMGGGNLDGTPVNTFLGKNPGDVGGWSEAQIQMFIIMQSRRHGLLVTGSMEQGLRSKSAGGKAKACGLSAGMPDMLYWLPNGLVIGVELKTEDGRLSDVQKKFHESLKILGHQVYVIYAKSPLNGWEQIQRIVA